MRTSLMTSEGPAMSHQTTFEQTRKARSKVVPKKSWNGFFWVGKTMCVCVWGGVEWVRGTTFRLRETRTTLLAILTIYYIASWISALSRGQYEPPHVQERKPKTRRVWAACPCPCRITMSMPLPWPAEAREKRTDYISSALILVQQWQLWFLNLMFAL